MPTPYIGEVRLFAGSFAPSGWALCNGQLLPIGPNATLFNLIGTTYGGDGVNYFALPNLQGRAPIHPGQGPGLSNYGWGDVGGVETVALVTNQMPAHTHAANGSSANGFTDNPGGGVPARTPSAIPQFGAAADTNLAAGAVAATGGGAGHNNMQPFLVLNYIIALAGSTPTP
jgi:microcystin-dependent protein